MLSKINGLWAVQLNQRAIHIPSEVLRPLRDFTTTETRPFGAELPFS